MSVELGIIEGYYGKPWSWAERRETIAALAPHGYGFYHYAPKADEFIRKDWREPYPRETIEQLSALSAFCREAGVRFGIGLSPFEIYRKFDAEARAALKDKLAELDSLGLDDLAILFDDMRGDLPDLAKTQIEIMHVAAAQTKATRVITCPGYYTDDPVLDRVFGQRPPNYLEDLGVGLDPKIQVFWTGEEVCAREYSPGHLARVKDQLRREPFLWDNYPVNDGPRMSQYLHLRAVTGRPGRIAPHVAAHGVNPALQPVLSRIPMLSLAESYREGDEYCYGAAFLRAAEAVLGPELGLVAQRYVSTLQDVGSDRLGDVSKLRARFAAFDHPGAREIVAYLDGGYRVTRSDLQT